MTLRRTQYQNANTHVPRGGDAARLEVLTDVESYVEPAAQLRSGGVLSWGITTGLGVTGSSGTAGLRVAPGSAVDAAGRLIALEAGGVAVLKEVDPEQVVGVETEVVAADGVTVPTDGRSGTVVLTVSWREVQQDPGVFVLVHAPWLRLVGEDDFADDGSAVPLAVADLADDGTVDDVNAGPRRLVGHVGTRLELRVPDTDGLAVGQRVAGELRARSDGALELAVAPDENSPPAPLWTAAPQDGVFVAGSLQIDGPARSWRTSSGGDGTLRVRDRVANADRLVVDTRGWVGIGVGDAQPRRVLHVEGENEIHSGGTGAGFSFADRGATQLVNGPGNGERWVWYSQGGLARLWSGGDKLTITPAGQVGIGHGAPSLLLDVNGRIRLRQAAESSAGLWLFQTTPNADRAFVGMAGDDDVGFWGNGAGQWGLTMNVNDLSVDLKGELRLPKTGDGTAVLTNRQFTNEGSLTGNNLKLQMDSRGIFGIGQRVPFEFMVGYEFTRPSGGPIGGLLVRNDFVRVFGVDQDGNAFFSGGKGGYVVDYFVNATGDTVERGDVVVLQTGGPAAFYGTADGIPVPEVDLTDRPYDPRVCGIVADVVAGGSLPAIDLREHPPAEDGDEEHPLARYAGSPDEDPAKVGDQQMGRMVTLGAWAYCKVDADIAPVEVGDLLTTSATRGHAQKAVDRDRALGAVLGKAMAPLASGRGVLPVLVVMQ